MQQFAIIFLSILLEALPFVLIGTIVSSLIEIFVSREWLANHLPKRTVFAYFIAGLAGFIFPVCECAIVPIMRRLVKKGMPIGVAITFMLATPTINPIVLLSTYFAFPTNYYFPILRGIMGYLIAIIVGFLMSMLTEKDDQKPEAVSEATECCAADLACGCGHRHQEHLACGCTDEHNQEHHHERGGCECAAEHHHEHHHEQSHGEEVCTCGHVHANKKDSFITILKSVLSHTSTELYEVGRFLIMGVLISSAMQTFVPKQYFIMLAENRSLSIFMMMALAFVLSLCSEADAFVAASFQGNLPNAPILAFLLFGPMMDIKNMMMLSGGFKLRFILRLIFVIGVVVFVMSSLSTMFF